MWSMEAGHKGDAAWARRMAPKLETLFWPPTVSETLSKEVGLFMIDLHSGRSKKLWNKSSSNDFPRGFLAAHRLTSA
jgi:hypothetical protein